MGLAYIVWRFFKSSDFLHRNHDPGYHDTAIPRPCVGYIILRDYNMLWNHDFYPNWTRTLDPLAAGAAVNSAGARSRSPLITAAFAGNMECVRLLLQVRKPPPNLKHSIVSFRRVGPQWTSGARTAAPLSTAPWRGDTPPSPLRFWSSGFDQHSQRAHDTTTAIPHRDPQKMINIFLRKVRNSKHLQTL